MPEPTERELKLAGQIIDTLAADFDPARYHDEYRDAVRDLIKTKSEGKEYVMPPPVAEAKVIDMMAALEQSLSRAREQKGQGGGAGKKKAAPGAGGKGSRRKAS